MDLEQAINGVAEFFEGDHHYIESVITEDRVPKNAQRQTDECRPAFDHCYVVQGGGGFTGDDFHGTVYFSIGGDKYLAVGY